MSDLSNIFSRLRNLFVTGNLTRRKGIDIQGTTRFGKTVDGQELFPYGFTSRAKKGTVLFFFQGGDVRAGSMLYTSNRDGEPELEDDDSALWTKDGGWIIARASGKVELFGKGYGGLIKVESLKDELAKNNQILQAILTIITGATIPEPGNGSPSALQKALQLALTGKQVGDFSNIASDKVFHGNGNS